MGGGVIGQGLVDAFGGCGGGGRRWARLRARCADAKWGSAGMRVGDEAGVVDVAFVGEDVEDPEVVVGAEALRDAEADDAAAAGDFEEVAGAAGVVAELFAGHLLHVAMGVAVVGNFVA